ncbi:hypothetical protein OQA88_7933 [Cercophora sp. LCS_1]
MNQNHEDELKDIWQDAVLEYRREAGSAVSPTLIRQLANIKSVEDVAAHLEASDASFASFRQTHQRLWTALKTFAAPIKAISKIAVTPTSVVDFGAASSAVLGAVVHLLNACEGVSNAYDWVEQLFRELQDFSERLGQYTAVQIDAVLRRKVVAILAVILKVIGRSQRLIHEGRFRQYLRVTFLGKDAATKKLVDDLNRLLGSEQRYVLGVTFASAQRTEEVAKSTHATVKMVLDAIEDDRDKKTQAGDESRLRNTLCGTSAQGDVEEIFVRNERSLLKGTGSWLENEPFFNAWMRREAIILWIFGGPGSGKTFLSTRITQLLKEKSLVAGNTDAVAYFFVKENSETLRDANIILKTLAWQIASQDMAFRRHAVAVCRERSLTITAEQTWENLFLGYYYGPGSQEQSAVTIVIDGLDEATAETRQTILALMRDLVSSQETTFTKGIQLAIVGRGSLRSDMDFRKLEKNYFIEVSRAKNRADIDKYIKKRLEELEILREMRKMKSSGVAKANKEGRKIMKKVSEGADGVFLWAKLLLDSLMKKDLPQVEAILANPPSTLDKMIWSVFDRLAKDEELDQQVLQKMLMFMTHARRPLLFGELDLVTSLPSRKPNYLLWKHTRGKLSSVFELKFPNDTDPDDQEESESGATGTEDVDKSRDSYIGGAESQTDDDQGFDFSSGSDDETSETDIHSDDDDIFSDTAHLVRAGTLNPSSKGEDDAEDAEDLLSHLSQAKLMTRVAFCHTRVRDFLVREGSAKTRRGGPLTIVPGADHVQADITVACLDIFQLEVSLKDNQRFLCDYPLCHLPYHLEGVDPMAIPPEQAARIIRGLYWLFGTRIGTTCLIRSVTNYDEFHGSRSEFWKLWVATDRYLNLVQSWLGRIEQFRGHSSRDDEAVAWMLTASKSLEELLRPAILTASSEWLCQPGFDSDTYFDKGEFAAWLINGWLTLIEGVTPLPEPMHYVHFDNVTPERVEYTASYAGLEQDVHWHTLLAWSLMMGYHYEAAVSHYRSAIKLSPENWVALEGLARCAGEQGQHADAIVWQEKAIDALPSSQHWISGYLWPRITEWATQVGRGDLAFSSAEKGFRADPTCILAATTYLSQLKNHGRSAEIIRTLEMLASTPVRASVVAYNSMVRLFVRGEDIFEPISWACAKEGRPRFVLDQLDKASTIVDSGDRDWIKVWLPYMAGCFKYSVYGLEGEGALLLETFLQRLSQKNENLQGQFAKQRKDARNILAQLYFDAAIEEWEADRSARTANADKLKQLAVEVSTGFGEDFEGFDLFRSDYPAMLWGRWLRDYKGVDEVKWRKCFRARLLEEMNTIDDDDPTNDTVGLTSLAVSLFHAGDKVNAAAIMAILFRLAGEGMEGNSNSREAQDPDSEDTSLGLRELKLEIKHATAYQCCNCAKNTTEVAELHVCEVCSGFVCWCEECLALLKEPRKRPQMTRQVCNPRHSFYRAWPVPADAMHVAAGSFENGVTVREAWLEKLRKYWWA